MESDQQTLAFRTGAPAGEEVAGDLDPWRGATEPSLPGVGRGLLNGPESARLRRRAGKYRSAGRPQHAIPEDAGSPSSSRDRAEAKSKD